MTSFFPSLYDSTLHIEAEKSFNFFSTALMQGTMIISRTLCHRLDVCEDNTLHGLWLNFLNTLVRFTTSPSVLHGWFTTTADTLSIITSIFFAAGVITSNTLFEVFYALASWKLSLLLTWFFRIPKLTCFLVISATNLPIACQWGVWGYQSSEGA